MNSEFQQHLESRLSEHLDESVSIRSSSGLGGGCINDAQRLETSAGDFFLKSNLSPLPHMFEREANGLQALYRADAIAVPMPISSSNGEDGIPPYLLTTFLHSAPKVKNFDELFGQRFAALHRQTAHEKFGFDHDNYLGSTKQVNQWESDWTEFFAKYRLGFQLDLARQNGYTGELQKLGERLMEKLGLYLDEPAEKPCLLHGDLWGGNAMADEKGEPAIIDPACYYGRREADLAMTKLFGGFGSRFYVAYEEAWPLTEGSEERLDIYQLYHLLNHLNLFGGSYLGGCLRILKRYA